jgi:hypothetical protein
MKLHDRTAIPIHENSRINDSFTAQCYSLWTVEPRFMTWLFELEQGKISHLPVNTVSAVLVWIQQCTSCDSLDLNRILPRKSIIESADRKVSLDRKVCFQWITELKSPSTHPSNSFCEIGLHCESWVSKTKITSVKLHEKSQIDSTRWSTHVILDKGSSMVIVASPPWLECLAHHHSRTMTERK